MLRELGKLGEHRELWELEIGNLRIGKAVCLFLNIGKLESIASDARTLAIAPESPPRIPQFWGDLTRISHKFRDRTPRNLYLD